MEELLEFEVMWPENEDRPISIEWSSDEPAGRTGDLRRRDGTQPVSIPNPVSWRPSDSDSDSDWDSESDNMVPPHVLVSRRWSEPSSVAFSLCSGPGRTLKGRELSNVRDFVLRMTGFFET